MKIREQNKDANASLKSVHLEGDARQIADGVSPSNETRDGSDSVSILFVEKKSDGKWYIPLIENQSPLPD